MISSLIGGGALSREAFYDRTRILLATQAEVRRLAGMAERERMARDLHDLIGRTLTLIALQADLVVKLATRDIATASVEARRIGDQARASLTEIRAALAGRGGGSLAGEFAASVAALRAVGVQPDTDGDPGSAPPDAGAVLAMALREAVTNVIRHSDATRCRIELVTHVGQVVLVVTDDGVSNRIVEGQGLTGMRQRLIAAGGKLTISAAATGTKLVASVPA